MLDISVVVVRLGAVLADVHALVQLEQVPRPPWLLLAAAHTPAEAAGAAGPGVVAVEGLVDAHPAQLWCRNVGWVGVSSVSISLQWRWKRRSTVISQSRRRPH